MTIDIYPSCTVATVIYTLELFVDAEEFDREVKQREKNKDLAKKDKKAAAAASQSTPNSTAADSTPLSRTSPSTPTTKRSHATSNNPPASTENVETTPHGPTPEKR